MGFGKQDSTNPSFEDIWAKMTFNCVLHRPETGEQYPLEIFIAHSTRDGDLAVEIKKQLEGWGATTFIAPDDIVPSEVWRQKILTQLDTCTALIAVVTENFVGSPFANQEAGIELGKGKQVIPLRFEEAKLPGFLESLQAIPTTRGTIDVAVKKVVHAIEVKDPTYIRTGYIPTSEVERITIEAVREHTLRTGKDTMSVKLKNEDIEIEWVVLREENKTYELTGSVDLQRKHTSGYDNWYFEYWSWSIIIDAISGRVMSKKVWERA